MTRVREHDLPTLTEWRLTQALASVAELLDYCTHYAAPAVEQVGGESRARYLDAERRAVRLLADTKESQ